MPIQVRELIDVEVLERSLVGKPANRCKFICFKSEEGGDEPVTVKTDESDDVAQQFEEALNAAVDGEDEIVEKAASTKAKNAIRGVLRMLNSVKDELPDDIMEKLAALLGEQPGKEIKPRKKTKSVETAADPAPEPEPEPAPVPAPAKKNKGDGADGEPIPDAVMAIAKAADPEDGAKIIEAWRNTPAEWAKIWLHQITKGDARMGELEGKVNVLLEKEDEQKCAGIVKELDLPGDRDQLTAFVHSLTPEMREKYVASHKSAAEAATKALRDLTTARGTDLEAPAGEDSAIAEATREAEALIEKGEGKVTMADALTQVWRLKPDLYERYRRESYSE